MVRQERDRVRSFSSSWSCLLLNRKIFLRVEGVDSKGSAMVEALSEERVSCLVLRTKSLRLLWPLFSTRPLSTCSNFFRFSSLVADLTMLEDSSSSVRSPFAWTLDPFHSFCARIFSKSKKSQCGHFAYSDNFFQVFDYFFAGRFDHFGIV